MFWVIFGCITSLKLLLMPAYHSTDFEVHRNWLAITHSLPVSEWYYENTSPWTLDYPPFFAYFEYLLSHVAKYFDPEMLKVHNIDYASDKTILFQRLSVIVTDLVYVFGVKKCIDNLNTNEKKKDILAFILLTNVGLIFIDHIHFQYNGFLFGIFFLSIAKLLERKYLQSAVLFACLLNFKHIFLYIAPTYGVFFLKFYCINSDTPFKNIFKLFTLGSMCLIAFIGPFAEHIPQVISRLFPFKRGLTHAYWAPNFWALYNFIDKIGCMVYGIKSNASNTGGLVKEYEHLFLPSVKPGITFILCAIFMIPCIIKLMMIKHGNRAMTKATLYERLLHIDFIKAIVICSCTSFMFGWHVHEKAILMVLIPLGLLSAQDVFQAEMMFFLSVVGYYSLFPLLFEPELLLIKYSLYLAYNFTIMSSLKLIHSAFRIRNYECLYYFGFIALIIYENILQYVFRLDKKLPFLPLMLTSVYCSIGVVYFYIKYYYAYLSTGADIIKKKVK